MMTPEELTNATTQIAALEAQKSALDQEARDCNNVAKEHSTKAMEFISLRRLKNNASAKLEEDLKPLRKRVEQHNIEVAAKQNEERKAQAEANAAKAKAAAEQAKAEEAAKKQAEQSTIEELAATVKQLQEQLAAKG